MNRKLIVGIGIGVAVAILAVLSSSSLAPSTTQNPSNATSGGPSPPTISPVQSTPTAPAKKSYTLDLNETVGIATK